MKKGDVIQRKEIMPAGFTLMRGMEVDKVDAYKSQLRQYYDENVCNSSVLENDELNPGKKKFILFAEVCVPMQAKVNWIVGSEAGITLTATEMCKVIDIEKEKDWEVIFEATPQYQDSIEHLTDEQLRASIENLRAERLRTPATQISKKVKTTEPKLSAEDKKLKNVLDSLDPEKKLELMRKLGMVD